MPKFASIRRKKIRFKGNRYTSVSDDKPQNDKTVSVTSTTTSRPSTSSSSASSSGDGASGSGNDKLVHAPSTPKGLHCSVSEIKLQNNSENLKPSETDVDGDIPTGFRLVDIGVFLVPLLNNTRCQECYCEGLSVRESGKLGLASTLHVSCRNCGWTFALPTSSRTCMQHQPPGQCWIHGNGRCENDFPSFSRKA